jgi:hypothetical protein
MAAKKPRARRRPRTQTPREAMDMMVAEVRRRIDEHHERRQAMARFDPDLFERFSKLYRPGLVGLVGTNDRLGLAIREAQKANTPDGKPSLWSHCFILGELRHDRRGPGRTLSTSPFIFESDLMAGAGALQLKNGAQENWLGKWCLGRVEHAAVTDFRLPPAQRKLVLATALELVEEQFQYPIAELVGTWLAIAAKRRWLPNPLEDPHALYCSAFVRHCYREAGRDFVKSFIAPTNTTPEDVAQAGIRAGALTMIR